MAREGRRGAVWRDGRLGSGPIGTRVGRWQVAEGEACADDGGLRVDFWAA